MFWETDPKKILKMLKHQNFIASKMGEVAVWEIAFAFEHKLEMETCKPFDLHCIMLGTLVFISISLLCFLMFMLWILYICNTFLIASLYDIEGTCLCCHESWHCIHVFIFWALFFPPCTADAWTWEFVFIGFIGT